MESYCSSILSIVPDEVLRSSSKFLNLQDMSSVLQVSKGVLFIMDDDRVYHSIAEHRYPPSLLNTTAYDGSWKSLLKDGNVRNRIVVKIFSKYTMIPVSKRLTNNITVTHGKNVYGIVWDRLKEKVGFITGKSALIPVGPCTIRCYTDPLNVPISAFTKDLSEDGKAALMENLEREIRGDSSRPKHTKQSWINGFRAMQFSLLSIDQGCFGNDVLRRFEIEPSGSVEETLKRFFLDNTSNNINNVSKEFLGVEPSLDDVRAEMDTMSQEVADLHRIVDDFMNGQNGGVGV